MQRSRSLALLLSLLCASSAAAAFSASPEYEVKAAFLYKFGNFIEQPAPADGPFVLTILGDDPFGAALEAIVQGKTINGRPVQIRRVRTAAEVPPGGIVFISQSESPRLAVILGQLRTIASVTVSDIDGFATAGGMIGFIADHNRIRFEINPGAAAGVGVRINAKLLNLARIVGAEGSVR